jgi:hypothetical protein
VIYNIHQVVLSRFSKGEIQNPSADSPEVRYSIHQVVLSTFSKGEILHLSGGAQQIHQR